MIESSNRGQTLNSDDDYVLNVGTTVSSPRQDAITINGIAPVTFTNFGTITNIDPILGVQNPSPDSGIRFNVDGSLVNQASGDIVGRRERRVDRSRRERLGHRHQHRHQLW